MSSSFSTVANYGGRQPTNTAFIKQFVNSIIDTVYWVITQYNNIQVITPIINNDVLLENNLYVLGTIYGTLQPISDKNKKHEINLLDVEKTNNFKNLNPVSFIYNDDKTETIKYGFIAQDLENQYPELVYENKISNIKTIDILGIIPIIVKQLQQALIKIELLEEKTKTK